jgi:DNA-directed RNA polymerase specialized sigma24 family protein
MGLNGWTGQQVLDPSEIETRFSCEDGMGYLGSITTEPTPETQETVERIKDIMGYLPPREADFVDLYFFHRLRQTDIASIFRVSQPTVCYRLQRATSRILFLLELPWITERKMRKELKKALDDELDIEIMILMYRTTCQSEVAKRLEVSQGLVRHRFIRSIAKVKKLPSLKEYSTLFESISNNLNILREVRRASAPNFQDVIYIVD